MSLPHDNSKPAPALVFWIIWFAILQGLVVIQFFIGGGIPEGSDPTAPPLVFTAIAAGLIFTALGVRFWVIPQLKETAKKLTAMIIGLALSEAVGFLGIFVIGSGYPSTQTVLFGCSVACILCFAPVYAKPGAEDE